MSRDSWSRAPWALFLCGWLWPVACPVSAIPPASAPVGARAWAAAPGASSAVPAATPEQPTAVDSVYAALLDQHYDRGIAAPLVIVGESVDAPEELPRDDALRLVLERALDPVDPATISSYFAILPPAEPLPARFAARRPVRIVGREALEEIFSVCPGGWDRFAEIYPGVRGYLTLSRVAFDPEGREALVYTEERCGPWCAEGTFVLLRREAGAWRVHRKLTIWVS